MNPVLIEEALAAIGAIVQAVLAARANGDAHVDVAPVIASLRASIASDDAAAESAIDKKFGK